MNYTRTKDDVTLTSDYGEQLPIEGKNTLNYVDNVDHRQWSVTLGADTQVNKKHLLSYGIGLYGRQAKVADLKMRLIPINGISIPGITIKV